MASVHVSLSLSSVEETSHNFNCYEVINNVGYAGKLPSGAGQSGFGVNDAANLLLQNGF